MMQNLQQINTRTYKWQAVPQWQGKFRAYDNITGNLPTLMGQKNLGGFFLNTSQHATSKDHVMNGKPPETRLHEPYLIGLVIESLVQSS